jgi:hypothetical protein
MEQQYYIEPEWLEAIRNKPFFYPCAGYDWNEAITIFANVCSELWFCDTFYDRGMRLEPVINEQNNLGLKFISSHLDGNPFSIMQRTNGYRYLEPSRKYDTYERNDGSQCLVIRRRGFGQIALYDEFPDNSLGVFMHRCDSPGEGGSNAFFFDNKKYHYYKLSKLANTVTRKMSHRGLIITDGSNSAKGHHVRKHRGVSQKMAYEQLLGEKFIRNGLEWQCVGYIELSYRKSLVWGVTKPESK